MDVVAISTVSCPEWRWRIVNYAGEMLEESHETFPSIASALAEGIVQLRRRNDEDTSTPPPRYPRSTSYARRV